MKKIFLFFLLLFFIFPLWCTADQSVIINEIAWMGSLDSPYNEWIELYNATQESINLNGWKITSNNGSLTIDLTKPIGPRGFLLLARKSSTSVLRVTPDILYTGNLHNNGLSLMLLDGNNTVIDEVNFLSGWPAGNNTTKQTMERTSSLAWHTSKDAHGTPGMQNSFGAVNITKKILPQNYPTGIFINEVFPYTEAPVALNQWIELYNSNAFDVDISYWKLQNNKASYVLPKNLKIMGRQYLILKRPQTKLVLKRDQDSVTLLFPNDKITDTLSYQDAFKDKSYNKTEPGWQWNAPTPGTINNIISNDILPELKNFDINGSVVTATDSKPANESRIKNPWLLLLVSLGLIIISGVVVVIIIKFKR